MTRRRLLPPYDPADPDVVSARIYVRDYGWVAVVLCAVGATLLLGTVFAVLAGHWWLAFYRASTLALVVLLQSTQMSLSLAKAIIREDPLLLTADWKARP